MNKPKVFKLSLSLWLRGEGGAASSMCRVSDGLMCCLGQFAVQLGVDRDFLHDEGSLSGPFWRKRDVPHAMRPLLTFEDDDKTVANDSALAGAMMDINDDDKMSDDLRIDALRPLFRRLGYELEVVP